MVPLEQSKWIPKLLLLSYDLKVKIKLEMEWSGSTIWIALNRRRCDHRPLDDGFWWDAQRTLRIGRGPRIRLWMHRQISRAWSPSPLSWSVTYGWLRGWRSRWSPRLVSALRRVRRHSTLRRWNSQGLEGLKYRILRRGGSWPQLARQWRVGIASSNARHVRNGVRGVGRLFE